ncbi:MAG: NfeD family protein [Pirellulaceae bacterium]
MSWFAIAVIVWKTSVLSQCIAEQAIQTEQPGPEQPDDVPRQDEPVPNMPSPLPHAKHPVVIRFDHEINRYTEHYLYRKLELAKRAGADLVILRIESPGGELGATENIAAHLLDIDWAEIVAYIPQEAISGAALMSLACDDIVMRPNAVIGDAGVIFLDEDFMFKFADAKVVSELATRMRTIAEATGRPPALAEAMIDRDAVVYRVRHTRTEEEHLWNDADIQGSDEPDAWQKLNIVSETQKDRFLHVNGRRALQLGLTNAVVADDAEFFRRYGIEGTPTTYQWTSVDTTAAFLNHPFITFLLIFAGIIALYVEFLSPGIGAGGLVAAICFILFFWSRFLGGTADWLEVVLFGAGVILIMVELFVLPGFGIWGFTGILLMLASLILAGQDFIVPQTTADWGTLRNSVVLTLSTIIAVFGAAAYITSRLGTIPILSRLTLAPPTTSSSSSGAAVHAEPNVAVSATGVKLQVGDIGIAHSPLRPAGNVLFGDDNFDVVTDGNFVDSGSTVRVIAIAGNRIVVRQIAS